MKDRTYLYVVTELHSSVYRERSKYVTSMYVYEDYETAVEYARRCNSDPYNNGTEYMVHEVLLVEKEN